MKARNFLGSYLQKEDVEAPTVATISSAKEELLGEEKERKLVLYFKELDKGLTCNITNINTLITLFDSDETEVWTGKKITLFVDPNVTFGGKRTGGIRVRSASPEDN